MVSNNTKNKSDSELLSSFVHEGSQEAFQVIVQRYQKAVNAAAYRKINNIVLAEDVCQVVFLNLAKQASSLLSREEIGTWLCQVAMNQACMMVRSEVRRKKREKSFFDIQETENEESSWEELSLLLDDCLIELPESDRNVIVWRYMEKQSFAEVARRAGAKESAVRKRLQRALVKLSGAFEQQGVSVSAVTVAAFLTRHAVEAAPVHLSAQIANSVLTQHKQMGATSAGFVSRHSFKLGLASMVVLVGGVLFTQTQSPEKKVVLVQAIESQPVTKSLTFLIQEEEVNHNLSIQEEKYQNTNKSNIERASQNVTWWDTISSNDLNEMLKNLITAGLADEDIQKLFVVESLSRFSTNTEQIALVLEQLRLKGIPENHSLAGLWQKLADEYKRGSTKTLHQGGLPDDVFELFLSRLALITSEAPKQLEQQVLTAKAGPATSDDFATSTNESKPLEELAGFVHSEQGKQNPVEEKNIGNLVNQNQVLQVAESDTVSKNSIVETKNEQSASVVALNSKQLAQRFELSKSELEYLAGLDLTRNWNIGSLNDLGTVNGYIEPTDQNSSYAWFESDWDLNFWGDEYWAYVLDGESIQISDLEAGSLSLLDNSENEYDVKSVSEVLSFEEELVILEIERSLNELYSDLDDLYFKTSAENSFAAVLPTTTNILVSSSVTKGKGIEHKLESSDSQVVESGQSMNTLTQEESDVEALWESLSSVDRMVISLVEKYFEKIDADLRILKSENVGFYLADLIDEKEWVLSFELSDEGYAKYQEMMVFDHSSLKSAHHFHLNREELIYLEELGGDETKVSNSVNGTANSANGIATVVDSATRVPEIDLNLLPPETTIEDLGPVGYLVPDDYWGGYIPESGNPSWSFEEEMMNLLIQEVLLDLSFDLDELYYASFWTEDSLSAFESYTDKEDGSNLEANVTRGEIWASFSSTERMIVFVVEESFDKLVFDLKAISEELTDDLLPNLLEEKRLILKDELSAKGFELYLILD